MSPRQQQRGVALITAILLVALGTILATAIAFQNAMTARRGTASFAFEQTPAIAQAAEAFAAYVLREDSKNNGESDHPGEAWAQQLPPVEVVPGVMLEASLEDLQGRFNINSLIDAQGRIDEDALARFEKLLSLVEIDEPEKWAALIADWIDRDNEPHGFNGAEDNVYLSQTPAGYRPPNRPITSPSELLALPQFGRERYLKLAPYVTALPSSANTLNTCTASQQVLNAWISTAKDPGQINWGDSEEFAKSREGRCFPDQNDIEPIINALNDEEGKAKLRQLVGQKSQYFRLRSIVTIGTTQFALYSLMYRDQTGARAIERTFGSE